MARPALPPSERTITRSLRLTAAQWAAVDAAAQRAGVSSSAILRAGLAAELGPDWPQPEKDAGGGTRG